MSLAAALLTLITKTAADSDLWGHLRFGSDLIASGALTRSDPYSFTSDRPWINHEWLAEYVFAGAYSWFGPLGLNLLKLAVLGAIAGIMILVARRERAGGFARDVFVVLTVFTLYTRTQAIRPQMFSVALGCALLFLLTEQARGHTRALLGVPIIFAVWTNVHGGWLVGIGALGTWVAGSLFQQGSRRGKLVLVATGACALLATLVNPYGAGLWQFLSSTVRLSRADITDWKPLLQLPAAVLVIESILPLAAIVCVLIRRPRIELRAAMVLAVLAAATFRVGRVDAFFQSAVAILLAPAMMPVLNSAGSWFERRFSRRSLIVTMLIVVMAGMAARAVVRSVREIEIAGPWIPDAEGAVFLREHTPGARVLTWFDWGEYAIWHLSPAGIRVSFDGRRETVYTERVIQDHWAFYRGDPSALDYPDRIGADYVWVPRQFPVIDALRKREWGECFATAQSIVLGRHCPSPGHISPGVPTRRVFPGP